MVTQARINPEWIEEISEDREDRFEKMSRRSEWGMPSQKARTARRAECRKKGKERVFKNKAKRLDGIQRRRRAVWS